jgi:hypothetical protein
MLGLIRIGTISKIGRDANSAEEMPHPKGNYEPATYFTHHQFND